MQLFTRDLNLFLIPPVWCLFSFTAFIFLLSSSYCPLFLLHLIIFLSVLNFLMWCHLLIVLHCFFLHIFLVIYFLFFFLNSFTFSERTSVLWANYYSQYGSREALREKLYATATALSFNIMIIHSNHLYHLFSPNNSPVTWRLNLLHKEKQPLTWAFYVAGAFSMSFSQGGIIYPPPPFQSLLFILAIINTICSS